MCEALKLLYGRMTQICKLIHFMFSKIGVATVERHGNWVSSGHLRKPLTYLKGVASMIEENTRECAYFWRLFLPENPKMSLPLPPRVSKIIMSPDHVVFGYGIHHTITLPLRNIQEEVVVSNSAEALGICLNLIMSKMIAAKLS